MKLPEFLFIDPQGELTGAGFILSTKAPYHIGKVYKFKNREELQMFGEGLTIVFVVEGYNIAIVPYTSLQENKEHLNQTFIRLFFQSMASYYLNQKILPNAPHYKRYKQEQPEWEPKNVQEALKLEMERSHICASCKKEFTGWTSINKQNTYLVCSCYHCGEWNHYKYWPFKKA